MLNAWRLMRTALKTYTSYWKLECSIHSDGRFIHSSIPSFVRFVGLRWILTQNACTDEHLSLNKVFKEWMSIRWYYYIIMKHLNLMSSIYLHARTTLAIAHSVIVERWRFFLLFSRFWLYLYSVSLEIHKWRKNESRRMDVLVIDDERTLGLRQHDLRINSLLYALFIRKHK